MANIGSYVLSLQERRRDDDIDLQGASTQVLKAMGPDNEPKSFVRLLSESGLPEAQLQSAMTKLTREGLVIGNNDGFSLTKLGYQARLIVAS